MTGALAGDIVGSVYEWNPVKTTDFPLFSDDFESALRSAVSLGGDSDTLACITGGIAEPFYGGVPDFIARKVDRILHPALKTITSQFVECCCRRQ